MSDYLALTDEAVAELILWRLPVKSIIECRSVCKSWYSLITSCHFISTHLRRKTLTENPQICVYQRNSDEDYSGNCEFLFENQDYFRSLLFRVPHLPPRPIIQTIGSVNGLICLSIAATYFTRVVNFIVFNPSIGHFLCIPPVPPSLGQSRSYDVKSFGFDERTQDYIILAVCPDHAGFIYSLNSRCWRMITCPLPGNWEVEYEPTLFVNGKFYWLAIVECSALKFVMVFDIKTESFDRVSLPECVANSTGGIFAIIEFGESSIAVVQCTDGGCVTHLWMLKEYEYGSVESPWIKLTLASSKMEVLSIRNKDELLIRCDSGCIALQKIDYNNNKIDQLGEVKNIMDVNPRPPFWYTAHKYVPSLVLLDKKNDVDVPAPTHAIRMRTAPTHAEQMRTAPSHTMRIKDKRIKTSPTPRKRIKTF